MRSIILLLIGTFIVSCANNSGKKESEVKSTDQNSQIYNFEKHADINVFIDDLAKAVSTNDRSAVAKMTHFPFLDYWPQFITGNTIDTTRLTGEPGLGCKDSTEFLSRYDQIFKPQLVSAIKKKEFRGFDKEADEIAGDFISEGEYVIYEEEFHEPRPYAIAITKFNGIYKISRMAFSS